MQPELDIEYLYRKYGPMILRRCRSILNDEDAAFDAMQDVFVRLIRNKDKLKPDYMSSLLYRIATNICLNMIRDGRSVSVDSDNLLISMIVSTDDFRDRLIINEFIDYMFKNEHESTRTMAYLHYIDGLSYEEVGDLTGLSVSGVRKRLRIFKEKVSHLKKEAL